CAGTDGDSTLLYDDDAHVLLSAFGEGSRLSIGGGGWIGLEVAAGARGRGAEVAVVEAAPQPLHAAMGPELGKVFADLHRRHGVDLHLDDRVAEITVAGNTATGLRLAGGHELAAAAARHVDMTSSAP